MIKENIERVRGQIAQACAKIKVAPDKITLVCVTKGRPVAQILEAVSLGLKDIGENRVQEACQKYNQIGGVTWHMVGHLQTNKVKEALKIFDLIHSVDTVSLACQIDKQAAKISKIQDILLEVKTSGEPTKFGFSVQNLEDAYAEIQKLESIRVRGLMTIAPAVDDPQESRPYFRQLRQLRDKLNSAWLLSMGMTDDFGVAIEEGANFIRLGRGIFEENV